METKSLTAKSICMFCLNLYNTVQVVSVVITVITSIADARGLKDSNFQVRKDNTHQFVSRHPLLHPRAVLPPTRIESDQSDYSDGELLPNNSWDTFTLSNGKQPSSLHRQYGDDSDSLLFSKSLSETVNGANSFVLTSQNLPFPEHIYHNQEALTYSNDDIIDRNDDRKKENPHHLLSKPVRYLPDEHQETAAGFYEDDRYARPFVNPSQPPNNNGFFQSLPHLMRTELWPRTTGILQSLVNPFRRSSSSHVTRNTISSQELVLASPHKIQNSKFPTNAQISMSPFLISSLPTTEPHFKIELTHPNPESFATQSLTSFHSENPTNLNPGPHSTSIPPAFGTEFPKFSSPGPPDQTPFHLEALKAEIVRSPLEQNVPYTPKPKRLKPKPTTGSRRPAVINMISDLITEDMPTDLRYSRHICRTTGVCPYSLSWFENSFMRSLVKLSLAE